MIWRVAAALVALALASCAPRAFRDYRPDRPLEGDRVVAVGSAAFDPPVQRGPRPVASDPHGYFRSISVGFTRSADAPLTISRGHLRGLHGGVLVPGEGGYFIIEGPRSGISLRSLLTYLGEDRSYDPIRGRIRNLHFAACIDSYEVPIRPADRFVYIGAFTCVHRDGVGVEMSFADRYAEAQQVMSSMLEGQRLEHRLAMRRP